MGRGHGFCCMSYNADSTHQQQQCIQCRMFLMPRLRNPALRNNDLFHLFSNFTLISYKNIYRHLILARHNAKYRSFKKELSLFCFGKDRKNTVKITFKKKKDKVRGDADIMISKILCMMFAYEEVYTHSQPSSGYCLLDIWGNEGICYVVAQCNVRQLK